MCDRQTTRKNMNLTGIDLNLLVAFDALLEECHVTRAAKRVGLSQPGMSNALSRLRELLDDPVLVRTSDGMKPTPRALALAGPIRRSLEDIKTALVPEGFDPTTSDHTFRLAATDYAGFVLLPRIMGMVQRSAPSVNFSVDAIHANAPAQQIDAGTADLGIGFRPDASTNCHHATLYDETFVCMVRRDNPLIDSDILTVDDYARLPHALVTLGTETGSHVDKALEALGQSRRVAIRVPHYMVIPEIIASTDCVATVASRVARHFENDERFLILQPPVELPTFPVELFWHERLDRDPAHSWLRGQILDAAAE
jgi:DNA-binding transcriptional LysR family regulator